MFARPARSSARARGMLTTTARSSAGPRSASIKDWRLLPRPEARTPKPTLSFAIFARSSCPDDVRFGAGAFRSDLADFEDAFVRRFDRTLCVFEVSGGHDDDETEAHVEHPKHLFGIDVSRALDVSEDLGHRPASA